jgi:hypothetical protein
MKELNVCFIFGIILIKMLFMGTILMEMVLYLAKK